MTVAIPLSKLERWNPFTHVIWRGLAGPVTRDEVAAAIRAGVLRKTPLRPQDGATRLVHHRRIGFLVLNPDPRPLDIDVGVPELAGYRPVWPIADGNHRLAAAFYRGDLTIEADIGGSLKHARELFELDLVIRNNSMVLASTLEDREVAGVLRSREWPI